MMARLVWICQTGRKALPKSQTTRRRTIFTLRLLGASTVLDPIALNRIVASAIDFIHNGGVVGVPKYV